MSLLNCNIRCNCTLAAILASAVLGILTAFLQITGVILLVPVFLWVALGIATVYLAVLVIGAALADGRRSCECSCATLNTLLVGILGTVLVSVILLAVGIVATSVVSAILAGLLLFFLALVFSGTACYVKYLSDCCDG